MEAKQTTGIDELLQHDAWLRRMVSDLVEPDLVNDVVQETFLAAWLKGKRTELANLPGFLRRVGRNLAMRHRRTEVRRRQREQGSAPEEKLPSTSDMLERLQAHRQLTQAVAGLDEPYRTTILLRYFEDLSPKEIAERQRVPASTVRTRLDRGLDQLHGRLKGTDPRALAALFLWPGAAPTLGPVAGKASLATTLFSGAVFMSVHLKTILLGAAVFLALALGVWQSGVFGVAQEVVEPTGTLTGNADEKRGGAALPGVNEERRQLPGDKTKVPAVVPLRGRVADTRGTPLSNVQVKLYEHRTRVVQADVLMRSKPQIGGKHLATLETDRDGRFEFVPTTLGKDVEAVTASLGGDYVALRVFVPDLDSWQRERALIVASKTTELLGQVVDSEQMPVGGVVVLPRVPGLLGFPEPLDQAISISLGRATSDDGGAFRLRVPQTPEAELLVMPPSQYSSQTVRDLVGKASLRIVLSKKKRSKTLLVTGSVIDPGQRLVAGALIRIGSKETRSSSDGRFRIRVRSLPGTAKFLVARKGNQTRFFPKLLDKLRAEQRLTGIVLTLGGPARELRGRVVDQEGKPMVNLPVVLDDATYVEFVQSAEDLARGILGKIDTALSAKSSPAKLDARTDSEGRFTIGGLEDRPYKLRMFRPKTLCNITTQPLIPGDAEHEIRMDTSAFHALLTGAVRSRAGDPMVGVSVTVHFKTFDNGSMSMSAVGDRTKTDEKGRFTLKRVPHSGVHVTVSGKEIVDFKHAITKEDGGEGELLLEPFLRCHFRVELADKSEADKVRVEDAAGTVLELARQSGQMSMSGETWTVRRGKTPALAVSEAASTLILMKADKEVRTIPMRLVPGNVMVLR